MESSCRRVSGSEVEEGGHTLYVVVYGGVRQQFSREDAVYDRAPEADGKDAFHGAERGAL